MSIREGKLGIVRVTGKEMTALRENCLEVYDGVCGGGKNGPDGKPMGCGGHVNERHWHMAHIVGRGRGGSDVITNVVPTHPACHLVDLHNPKPVPPKERA